MALALLPELGPGDLLLLDRGYPGYLMFRAIIEQGVDFLIRLPKDGMFKEIQDFLARGKKDGKVTLHPPQNVAKENPGVDFPPLTLRVVAVALPGTGETAIFITTLLDPPKVSAPGPAEPLSLPLERGRIFQNHQRALAGRRISGPKRPVYRSGTVIHLSLLYS